MVKILSTQLAMIPGDITSQQPLGISINKPLKAVMREEWTKWMKIQDHILPPVSIKFAAFCHQHPHF
jgi:hypothetical protein